MRITITNRKSRLFDVCPACDVFINDHHAGKVFPAQTVSFNLENNLSYSIYCSYNYGKNNVEKSNTVHIRDTKNHELILGAVYSTSFVGQFKENMTTIFSKGYINVPDIELYEQKK